MSQNMGSLKLSEFPFPLKASKRVASKKIYHLGGVRLFNWIDSQTFSGAPFFPLFLEGSVPMKSTNQSRVPAYRQGHWSRASLPCPQTPWLRLTTTLRSCFIFIFWWQEVSIPLPNLPTCKHPLNHTHTHVHVEPWVLMIFSSGDRRTRPLWASAFGASGSSAKRPRMPTAAALLPTRSPWIFAHGTLTGHLKAD